jgi:hypothetical protein
MGRQAFPLGHRFKEKEMKQKKNLFLQNFVFQPLDYFIPLSLHYYYEFFFFPIVYGSDPLFAGQLHLIQPSVTCCFSFLFVSAKVMVATAAENSVRWSTVRMAFREGGKRFYMTGRKKRRRKQPPPARERKPLSYHQQPCE